MADSQGWQGELVRQDLQQARTELQHAMQQRDQISVGEWGCAPAAAGEGVTAVVGGGAGEREQWRQEVQKLQAALAAQQRQLEEASLTAARRAGLPAPAAVPCAEQGWLTRRGRRGAGGEGGRGGAPERGVGAAGGGC